MHNIKNRPLKEESSNYYVSSSSMSKTITGMSDPSIISTISSSNSQRYSDMTSSAISSDHNLQSDIAQFDIIDSLDYDDVDDGLIVDQEIMHQQREAFIRELYETEKKYLDTLELVLNSYILPLRKNTKSSSFNFLGMKKMPCTEREMKWLFGNFEQIHQVHVENLTTLDERLSIWGPTQIISDVVQTWFPRIQQQYHIYFDNYDILVTTFERLTRYQPFKKFTETVDKNVNLKGTTLLSLLQTPVTCIARYQRLLTTLADNTSGMHPDYIGLMQCKQRIQQIWEEFKPKINDAGNVDKVYQILTVMTGQPFSVKAERRLYLQNNFAQSTRFNGEDRTYFLFSDLLLYARQKQQTLHYKGHVVLERAKVRTLTTEESGSEEWSIEVTSPFQGVDSLNSTFMGSPVTHVIHTTSKEEQIKWTNCLETVIDKLNRVQQNKIMVNKKKLTPTTADSIKRQATTISSESTNSTNNKSF